MSKPPSKGAFWRAFAAVTILPINGSQKGIFGCLIDHANPKTGLCFPSEALIAAETGHPIRTVERAVAGLLLTPYLSRKQRPQSSNDYSINFDALSKAWDAYKGRGAAYRASKAGDQEMVTETVTDRSRKAKSSPSKVADQPVKTGGSIPSKVADKQEKITGKEEKKSRMASPRRGDGNSASLLRPAGEVKNVGGELARFERTFKQEPSSISDLKEWRDWLEELHVEGDMHDPNAQRAGRLADDVGYYLDEGADAPPAGEEAA